MPDTEKEALCVRIDELCAENERLRQELREYQATIDSLVDECTDHKAETAKLRELIADIHALDDLSYIPSWSLDEYGVRMADIERRMRELGLEVE